jgi:inositol transporter-like SP family MFS transporter
VAVTNLAGFVLFFLQARLGYTRESAAGPAGQMMMLIGIFILLSTLPAGWMADRWGRKRVVAWSGVVAAVGALITLFAVNLTLVFVGGCIIGIATGIFYAASWALGTSLVPKREAGRYLGISNLAGAGAGAVGAYIGGPVADFFTRSVPDTPGLGYVLIFAISAVLFLLSVVTLTQVKAPVVG